ncbi:MAG: hypothetical protein KJN71_03415 [Acidimicrobiia bacterium]|nr:hypothetical protein [Acidimicrobiia bacterium]
MDEDITLDPVAVLQFVQALDPKLFELAKEKTLNAKLTEELKATQAVAAALVKDLNDGGDRDSEDGTVVD